jgi:2-hydroxychromene-2-carboxylate isomerase
MKKIDFYCDFISPYVYLAWAQLPQTLEGLDVELIVRPVLFAGLLNAHGTRGPAEVPAKREFVFRDAARCAAVAGIPFIGPPQHPFPPLPALRFCTAVIDNSERLRLGWELARRCWGEGLNIADSVVLLDAAACVGLDGKSLLEKSQTTEVKAALHAATAAAISAGAFGVPTFSVDDQVFWGSDRLDHLRFFLEGRLNIDENLLAQALQRPRAADRQ